MIILENSSDVHRVLTVGTQPKWADIENFQKLSNFLTRETLRNEVRRPFRTFWDALEGPGRTQATLAKNEYFY